MPCAVTTGVPVGWGAARERAGRMGQYRAFPSHTPYHTPPPWKVPYRVRMTHQCWTGPHLAAPMQCRLHGQHIQRFHMAAPKPVWPWRTGRYWPPHLQSVHPHETRGQERGYWTSIQEGGPREWELVWKPSQPGVCPGLLEGLPGREEGLGAPRGGIRVGRGSESGRHTWTGVARWGPEAP